MLIYSHKTLFCHVMSRYQFPRSLYAELNLNLKEILIEFLLFAVPSARLAHGSGETCLNNLIADILVRSAAGGKKTVPEREVLLQVQIY